MRNVIALNIATAVFHEREKYKLILLENRTETSLVTGDQPVINIYGVNKPPREVVEQLEYYYPISPDLGILISERVELRSCEVLELTSEQVSWYNNAIATESYEQTFSNSNFRVVPPQPLRSAATSTAATKIYRSFEKLGRPAHIRPIRSLTAAMRFR